MNKRINYGFDVRLLTIEECCSYLGVGKNTAIQVAKEVNAEVKIGRCKRYDKKALDKYIDNLTIHKTVAVAE